jgi:hypothetical protein
MPCFHRFRSDVRARVDSGAECSHKVGESGKILCGQLFRRRPDRSYLKAKELTCVLDGAHVGMLIEELEEGRQPKPPLDH